MEIEELEVGIDDIEELVALCASHRIGIRLWLLINNGDQE